jgi:hypothetical protein
MSARPVGRLGALVGGAIALLAAGMPADGASSPSDLVELSVTVGSRAARVGGSLVVRDVVANRGDAAAPRSTTAFYLSRARVHRRGDPRIGARGVGSLRPHASSRGAVRVHVPGRVSPGPYHVIACADAGRRVHESNELDNCRASTQVVKLAAAGADHTPPVFGGLKAAFTCIPGPIGGGRTGSYHLAWDRATDDVTPSSQIVYDVYQATASGRENFSQPTYTTPPGATTFATPPLPATKTYYFVVRARDRAGNRDHNRVERAGVNRCV